uniref:Uncharacterized protein n=1 Tax=Chromera velia CCMP2878 TaxID=1169474 RepID=A0A0G4F682_9ALVE|eukprot:Cvel_2784.t1-p1 / transcript=Cvel_2784.t1 / gene=Cvel_2784 / organism=Chromera_velia_CCMP2878 / gene_product=hypothetical protein / transcript_product=hypothetical protein / location=Cvel_scaffold112:67531-72073(-) / protein_length=1037 / sequence_SO=supercontig / SO=protein_coding / is_pseudo=false
MSLQSLFFCLLFSLFSTEALNRFDCAVPSFVWKANHRQSQGDGDSQEEVGGGSKDVCGPLFAPVSHQSCCPKFSGGKLLTGLQEVVHLRYTEAQRVLKHAAIPTWKKSGDCQGFPYMLNEEVWHMTVRALQTLDALVEDLEAMGRLEACARCFRLATGEAVGNNTSLERGWERERVCGGLGKTTSPDSCMSTGVGLDSSLAHGGGAQSVMSEWERQKGAALGRAQDRIAKAVSFQKDRWDSMMRRCRAAGESARVGGEREKEKCMPPWRVLSAWRPHGFSPLGGAGGMGNSGGGVKVLGDLVPLLNRKLLEGREEVERMIERGDHPRSLKGVPLAEDLLSFHQWGMRLSNCVTQAAAEMFSFLWQIDLASNYRSKWGKPLIRFFFGDEREFVSLGGVKEEGEIDTDRVSESVSQLLNGSHEAREEDAEESRLSRHASDFLSSSGLSSSVLWDLPGSFSKFDLCIVVEIELEGGDEGAKKAEGLLTELFGFLETVRATWVVLVESGAWGGKLLCRLASLLGEGERETRGGAVGWAWKGNRLAGDLGNRIELVWRKFYGKEKGWSDSNRRLPFSSGAWALGMGRSSAVSAVTVFDGKGVHQPGFSGNCSSSNFFQQTVDVIVDLLERKKLSTEGGAMRRLSLLAHDVQRLEEKKTDSLFTEAMEKQQRAQRRYVQGWQGDGVEGQADLKAPLVFLCTSWMLCGGSGDRINGILFVVLLAVVTARPFLICSNTPLPFPLFFQPVSPSLDWRTDCTKLWGSPSVVWGIDAIEMVVDSFDALEEELSRVEGEEREGRGVLMISANSRGTDLVLNQNGTLGHRARSLGLDLVPSLSRRLFRAAFAPTPALLDLTALVLCRSFGGGQEAECLDAEVREWRTSPPPFIAIHFRSGDQARNWKDPKRHSMDTLPRFFECARRVEEMMVEAAGVNRGSKNLERGLPWIILSDAEAVWEYPEFVLLESQGKVFRPFLFGELGHTDLSEPSLAAESALDAVIGQMIIGQASAAVISKSNFGELSAELLGETVPDTFFWNGCTRVDFSSA